MGPPNIILSFSFKVILKALNISLAGVPILVDTSDLEPSFLTSVQIFVTGIWPLLNAFPIDATASALRKHTPISSGFSPAGTTLPRISFIIRCGSADG